MDFHADLRSHSGSHNSERSLIRTTLHVQHRGRIVAPLGLLFFSLFVGVAVFDVVVVIVTDVVVGVIVTYYDVSVVVVVGVGVRACMRVYIGERERETFLLPFVFVLMPKEYADAQRMGS